MSILNTEIMEKSKTILVIEDSEDLRADIIEMLSMVGYMTSGARNGAIGVEEARRIMPDLILCDIMMPELDGYGVLKTLRDDTQTAAIPFIFLTAKTEHIDQRQGMVLGANDFLTKPFMAEELLESIDAQLKKREEQLAAVKQRIDDLTSSIALALPHEMRTPLNTVIGFSEMLQSEAQNLKPDQVAGWATHINKSGYRLLHVVENYLLYVRLQLMIDNNIKGAEDDVMYGMYSTIQGYALNKAEKLSRKEDLSLELEKAPALKIKDEFGIKIIDELLDNAFKFSEAGQAVRVQGYVDGDAYVFVVEDEGRGMSTEQIQGINAFMQFERAHYEQQGTGLGLALIKQLCDIYEVDFAPIGEKDKGITATVRFKVK
ncbi:MAG: hypothetical protein Phog2KO_05760 [Phototrophicaceae bacterium]